MTLMENRERLAWIAAMVSLAAVVVAVVLFALKALHDGYSHLDDRVRAVEHRRQSPWCVPGRGP